MISLTIQWNRFVKECVCEILRMGYSTPSHRRNGMCLRIWTPGGYSSLAAMRAEQRVAEVFRKKLLLYLATNVGLRVRIVLIYCLNWKPNWEKENPDLRSMKASVNVWNNGPDDGYVSGRWEASLVYALLICQYIDRNFDMTRIPWYDENLLVLMDEGAFGCTEEAFKFVYFDDSGARQSYQE